MAIRNATILITDRCNSKCTTCNIWKEQNKRKELTSNQYFTLFSRSEFSLLDDVNISGGEATLRDDIADVTEAILFGKHVQMFFLSTNGTNPSKALECLKAARSSADRVFVSVSIDGDKTTHKIIRGIDSYDAALHTISLCKEWDSSIITNLSLTLSARNTNLQTLRHLKHLADEYKSTLSYRFAYNSSNYFHNSSIDFLITNEMRELVRAFIRENSWDDPFMRIQYDYLKDGHIKIMKKNDVVCCNAGKKFVLVAPNGDIYPCINSNHIIGDLERGIFDVDYAVGDNECCPCCMELCVWPNISWGDSGK